MGPPFICMDIDALLFMAHMISIGHHNDNCDLME